MIKILGFYFAIGRNETYTFGYFATKRAGMKWLIKEFETEVDVLIQREFKVEIKELELKICTGILGCNNLIPEAERECLRCEKIKDDARAEQKEQRETENSLYPEKV